MTARTRAWSIYVVCGGKLSMCTWFCAQAKSPLNLCSCCGHIQFKASYYTYLVRWTRFTYFFIHFRKPLLLIYPFNCACNELPSGSTFCIICPSFSLEGQKGKMNLSPAALMQKRPVIFLPLSHLLLFVDRQDIQNIFMKGRYLVSSAPSIRPGSNECIFRSSSDL
jgi:hypothetical protein